MSNENPVVLTTNLSKSFDSPVLKNINLKINSGEIVGYKGQNGAGKSTTIKVLTGIIPDFDGTVTILGYDVKKEAIEVKKRIGYIPENAVLYETLTPLEYLHFIGQLYTIDKNLIDKKAKALLQLFDLGNHLDNRMTTFSKGMKQKVLLIAGLIHNPSLIFLDEPLSGLDANTVILVKEILLKLKEIGRTIFYSSHIMDVVEKISDRIIILNKGELIADGTFQELNSKAIGGGSLENIFSDLTGSNEYQSTANDFIEVLQTN
jgi:ABC-2 type transport system ATP-binding protein